MATSSDRLFQLTVVFGKYEYYCLAVWYKVGKWTGLVGSSDSGLLSWCILAVDGDQSVVKLVEVGESGASASGLHGWPMQYCQHIIQT